MFYDKRSPFFSKIVERTLLSRIGSSRQTYGVTLDLAGSGIVYEPGDALAVIPRNDPAFVELILEKAGRTGKERVIDPKTAHSLSLRQFLSERANLSRVTGRLVRALKGGRERCARDRDVIDLLSDHLTKEISLETLVGSFAPLLPRFYSVASAQTKERDRVDLLVSRLTYKMGDKTREGVASRFLCRSAEVGRTPVAIYHHPNRMFTIPKDRNKPLIMVGPGTGVAPYRAFLQERLRQGATGGHWLFFGERERAYDFYYEEFFSDLARKGVLRLDCAFSRDQREKIYVQDEMVRRADLIGEWIEGGAIIYICGDAHKMAKGVTKALREIVMEKKGLSEGGARDFLRTLRREGRLLMDVY